jgi:hypothetical protein
VEIFREPIPAPEDPKQRSLVLWCVNHALNEFGPDAFQSKPPEWRRCAAVTVLSACLKAEAIRLKAKVDANAARHYDPKRIETAQAARARLEAIRALLCDGHADQDTTTAGATISRRISDIPWGAP